MLWVSSGEVNLIKRLGTRFGGGSYQSASDPRLHFGLGAAAVADKVEVRWPSGQVDTHVGLAADAIYRLREGDGRAVPWSPGPKVIPTQP